MIIDLEPWQLAYLIHVHNMLAKFDLCHKAYPKFGFDKCPFCKTSESLIDE